LVRDGISIPLKYLMREEDAIHPTVKAAGLRNGRRKRAGNRIFILKYRSFIGGTGKTCEIKSKVATLAAVSRRNFGERL